MSSYFLENDSSIESQFRAIFLLGSNTATYKFALAQSLLQLHSQNKTTVLLDDLTPIFASHLLRHVKNDKKQIVGNNMGKLIHALTIYNNEQINEDLMLNIVRVEGFKYVLDAFHRLPKKEMAIPFFKKTITTANKQGIVLTDDLYKLFESHDFKNFHDEIEARWNLVESTWSEKNGIHLQYDDDIKKFFYLKPISNNSFMHSHLRTDLTYARAPLSGYQKGRCFYCFKDITIISNQPNTCEVDHMIPMAAQYNHTVDLRLNSPWNLVLSCKECNGWLAGGKSDRLPLKLFIERLLHRNEYFIESAHPLRESIITSTGKTTKQRGAFIYECFETASQYRKPSWKPREILGIPF